MQRPVLVYLCYGLPPIVSPQEWDAARQELLVKEKELTRARDALAAQRRRMPRMAVDKDYLFDGPSGPASLHDCSRAGASRSSTASSFIPMSTAGPTRAAPVVR